LNSDGRTVNRLVSLLAALSNAVQSVCSYHTAAVWWPRSTDQHASNCQQNN